VIHEWKMDGVTRNFGDALYEVLLPEGVYKDFAEDTEHLYFPIGSVISTRHIIAALAQDLTPVFINCGWRGEMIQPDLIQQSKFIGCRGPYTQRELARHGVEVEVTHDPAYQLPEFVPKGAPNALAIVVRHIADPSDYNQQSIFELKADAVFSPVVETKEDIIEFVQKISGARFVLAGSMHAAIVAHAYGVPFAPLRADDDYIDCMPKWFDWMAAEGLGKPKFCKDVVEGREWYRSLSKETNDE